VVILLLAVSPCVTLSLMMVYWAANPPAPRYEAVSRLRCPDGNVDAVAAIEKESWIERMVTPGAPGPVVVVVSVMPAGSLVTEPAFRDGLVVRVSAEGRPSDTIRFAWASPRELTIEVLRGDVLLLRPAAEVEVSGARRVVEVTGVLSRR
jgi:hypothetical protein